MCHLVWCRRRAGSDLDLTQRHGDLPARSPPHFLAMLGYSAFDKPPPHVPAHTVHVSTALLAIGGSCYIVSHFARLSASTRTGSYDWPLLAMALNSAWELVMGCLAPAPYECAGSLAWGLLSVYVSLRMLQRGAKREWAHSPLIAKNIFSIFCTMLVISAAGVWAFTQWFVRSKIGAGRLGRTGPAEADWAELAWWTGLGIQTVTILTQFAMLLTRGDTRGTGRNVWAWQGFGMGVGFYGSFLWRAYFWPEAHPYITNPFSLWLFSIALATDYIAYPLLWNYVVAREASGRRVKSAQSAGRDRKTS